MADTLSVAENVEPFEEKFRNLIIRKRFDAQKCGDEQRIEILLENMHGSRRCLVTGEMKYLFQHRTREAHPPTYIRSCKEYRNERACCAGDDRNADDVACRV